MRMGTLLSLTRTITVSAALPLIVSVTPCMFCISLLPPLLQSSFAVDIQRHLLDTGSFHDGGSGACLRPP
jgi:hypothetical protein